MGRREGGGRLRGQGERKREKNGGQGREKKKGKRNDIKKFRSGKNPLKKGSGESGWKERWGLDCRSH